MAHRRSFLKSAALAPATLVLPGVAVAAEPSPSPAPQDAVAQALDHLAGEGGLAERLGRAAEEVARAHTWPAAVAELLRA